MGVKLDLGKYLFIVSQIIAYILAIIIVVQIIKYIFGGTWQIENVILAIVILNMTISFGLISKISRVDKTLHGHIEWHRGKDGKTI